MDLATRDALLLDLRRDEGVRRKPYRDSLGVWTVGVGHNLESGPTLSDAVITQILSDDLDSALAFLDLHLPWWLALDPVRQRVLANMAFNLGPKLLDFHRMLAAMQMGQFAAAAQEMSQSLWGTQVGARADRLARMTETGQDLHG